MQKKVLFIANSLDNAYKFQQVLSNLQVGVSAGSTDQAERLFASGQDPDLVIFEARSSTFEYLPQICSAAESRSCPLLVIVDESSIGRLQLPGNVPSDFVMHNAGSAECSTRVERLLGSKLLGGTLAEGRSEIIEVDDMVVNLATYQVTVDGEPVDFTYLEYALLAYLVQNPDHTFSRDVLLQNVWGFDYYGSSRTVDVHVRRVRAKLGPSLAQHLETIRGVGYFWSSS